MRATLNNVLSLDIRDKQKAQLVNYLEKSKKDEIKKLRYAISVRKRELKRGLLDSGKKKYRAQIREFETRITYLQKGMKK